MFFRARRAGGTTSDGAAKLRTRLRCETLEGRTVPTYMSLYASSAISGTLANGTFYYDETQVNSSQASQTVAISDLQIKLWGYDYDDGGSTARFEYGQLVGADMYLTPSANNPQLPAFTATAYNGEVTYSDGTNPAQTGNYTFQEATFGVSTLVEDVYNEGGGGEGEEEGGEGQAATESTLKVTVSWSGFAPGNYIGVRIAYSGTDPNGNPYPLPTQTATGFPAADGSVTKEFTAPKGTSWTILVEVYDTRTNKILGFGGSQGTQ